jgi:transcriptional regulator with XRE-family HTH domain
VPKTSIPALPFCHRTEIRRRPKSSKYPCQISTLGDHIRSLRLDLGLYQKDVASQIDVATIILWESNATEPQIHHFPKIRDFLGYDLSRQPKNLAEILLDARNVHGIDGKQPNSWSLTTEVSTIYCIFRSIGPKPPT